jgi:predicted dehydrogenase
MSFGWAIFGTGQVARKFALGLGHPGPAARVLAVGSRDPARGAAFAAAVAPGAAALGHAAALAHPGVQAVYVATPPALHEEHARMAIAAGKAVLIEKPFAADAAAAARIAAAAREGRVFCMEAMWTRFLPLAARLRETVAAGTLGEPRAFFAQFMGSDQPDPGTSLFDPALGGGALLHRGIYPLSLARQLMGPVTALSATGRIGPTGVDEEATLVLTHASGAVSTLRASLRAGGTNGIEISGTEATLRVDPPVFRPFRAQLMRHPPRAGGTGGGGGAAWRERGAAQALNRWLSAGLPAALRAKGVIRAPYAGNGYGHEAAEVAQGLAGGLTESPLMPLNESVEILGLIDRALGQIRGQIRGAAG